MKTHGESRRLPFEVGPMEAEGCPVTPSNGIEIQRYMSCPYQVISSEILRPSQDSIGGMNTCMLHPPLGRVSRDPSTVLA